VCTRGTSSKARVLPSDAGYTVRVTTFFSTANLRQSLNNGDIAAADLDEMVRRQLRVIVQMGWLDKPLGADTLDTQAHRALNREAARSSFVLLKNEKNLLPLDRDHIKRLAIIGPRAALVDSGGGSAQVQATYQVSLTENAAARKWSSSTYTITRRQFHDPNKTSFRPAVQCASQPPAQSRVKSRNSRDICTYFSIYIH